MAGGVNKVIIVGNLGQDPELKYTADGRAICNFSVATNETWKDKNSGERKEKVDFHRIVIFGPLAEIAGQYLAKGKQVYLEGKLQTRSWDDPNTGDKKYMTEVVIDQRGTMQMLGSRGDGPGPANLPAGGHTGRQTQQQPYDNTATGGYDDSDIPF